MAKPRSQQLDLENGGFCHLMSRCVRQEFLLAEDPDTGRDVSYRRDWIEQRLLLLSSAFAVEVFAYAVMSNHFHLVLGFHPDHTREWTREEIARRWLRVYPKSDSDQEANLVDWISWSEQRAEELRMRLSHPGWLMRGIKQYVAKRANREDGKTGSFWSGRYTSKKIDSIDYLVACMAYVDLNPVSAGFASSPEMPGQHTSLRRRLEEQAWVDNLQTPHLHNPSTEGSPRDSGEVSQAQGKDSSSPSPGKNDENLGADVVLRPLTAGDGSLACRSADAGPCLGLSLEDYRRRVGFMAKRDALRWSPGLPRIPAPPDSADWHQHWDHHFEGLRARLHHEHNLGSSSERRGK